MLSLAVEVAPPAEARVAGGGPKKSDCYAEFDGVTATHGVRVDCIDGDPKCDSDNACGNGCTFRIKVCVYQSDVPGCAPQPVTGFPIASANLNLPPTPVSAPACGDPTDVLVPLKKNGKAGKRVVKLVATSSGKPNADRDRLVLRCLPRKGTCPITTTTTTTTSLPGMTSTTSSFPSVTITTSSTTSTTATTLPSEPQACTQIVGGTQEPIACGVALTCRLDPLGDTDRFTFSSPGEAVVSIDAVAPDPATACWQLFDPSGNPVGARTCTELAEQRGPLAAGRYTIVVDEQGNNDVTEYVISFQGISESFHCGVPLSLPEDLATDSLQPPGDTDAFNFVAAAGQTVSVNAVAPDPATACWQLFDPDGNAVGARTCTEHGEQRGPLAAGTHTIVIDEQANNDATTYTISLIQTGGP